MSGQAPRCDVRNFDRVLAEDERPNRRDGTCFYCQQPIGAQHTLGCVIRQRAGYYHVALRKNATGEIRMYREDFYWGDGAEYMWTEGNYSCDCNRHMMFQRAAGEEPEWDTLCGNERYAALYAQTPEGKRIVLEDK